MRTVRHHLRSVDSTNTYAKLHAAGFDPAAITVVTADEQTAGRGRQGRSWVSAAEEDIKATFAFQVPRAALPTAYQLSPLLSVVAVRALARSGFVAQIKWPNDIILSGRRKVGGILCEMESIGDCFWAALGIGLNVNSTPEELGVARPVWPLTTLRAEAGGAKQDVAGLTEALCEEFAKALPEFFTSGFAPFQAEYEASSVLLGRRVRFREGADVLEGVVERFGDDGRIFIRLPPRPAAAPAAAAGAGKSCAAGGGAGSETASLPPFEAVAAAVGVVTERARAAAAAAGELRGFLSGEVSGLELAPGDVVQGSAE